MSMLRLIEISEGGTAVLPAGDVPDMVIDLCLAYDRIYQERGFVRPWVGYLAVRDGEEGAEIVGACGFKGPPQDQKVEISFLTFQAYQQQGVATMMVRELTGIAEGRNMQIYAQTAPDGAEAGRVLQRAGFVDDAIVDTPDYGPVRQWIKN